MVDPMVAEEPEFYTSEAQPFLGQSNNVPFAIRTVFELRLSDLQVIVIRASKPLYCVLKV